MYVQYYCPIGKHKIHHHNTNGSNKFDFVLIYLFFKAEDLEGSGWAEAGDGVVGALAGVGAEVDGADVVADIITKVKKK